MRQIVLLRGINVGRAKRIAMADLRELLAGLGYTDVKTLLNSGNALVTTDESAIDTEKAVRAAISKRYGFDVAVVVRTADQLTKAMTADPFQKFAPDGSRHFIGFCSAKPKAAAVKTFAALSGERFQVAASGNHIYAWCPDGLMGSGLGDVDLPKVLGVDCTIRNWNTAEKLALLAV
ncbi:MAG: DUF1697 domain-containing protein [Actinomycetota bacterium]|nr:DUF1697 domain-containing protein [Actinomycetota bacterium]